MEVATTIVNRSLKKNKVELTQEERDFIMQHKKCPDCESRYELARGPFINGTMIHGCISPGCYSLFKLGCDESGTFPEPISFAERMVFTCKENVEDALVPFLQFAVDTEKLEFPEWNIDPDWQDAEVLLKSRTELIELLKKKNLIVTIWKAKTGLAFSNEQVELFLQQQPGNIAFDDWRMVFLSPYIWKKLSKVKDAPTLLVGYTFDRIWYSDPAAYHEPGSIFSFVKNEVSHFVENLYFDPATTCVVGISERK